MPTNEVRQCECVHMGFSKTRVKRIRWRAEGITKGHNYLVETVVALCLLSPGTRSIYSIVEEIWIQAQVFDFGEKSKARLLHFYGRLDHRLIELGISSSLSLVRHRDIYMALR